MHFKSHFTHPNLPKLIEEYSTNRGDLVRLSVLMKEIPVCIYLLYGNREPGGNKMETFISKCGELTHISSDNSQMELRK